MTTRPGFFIRHWLRLTAIIQLLSKNNWKRLTKLTFVCLRSIQKFFYFGIYFDCNVHTHSNSSYLYLRVLKLSYQWADDDDIITLVYSNLVILKIIMSIVCFDCRSLPNNPFQSISREMFLTHQLNKRLEDL